MRHHVPHSFSLPLSPSLSPSLSLSLPLSSYIGNLLIEVFSVCHLHAPPPDRSVPLQWLAPQFGMASLCPYAHSLERFLRHSFLNLRRFYLVVLGLGAPLSSPT